jgi:SAM-dependent methyltransferase
MEPSADHPTRVSWRDPDGFVVKTEGRILRAVVADKFDQTRVLLGSPWFVSLIDQGLVPRTHVLASPPASYESVAPMLWLEHEVLEFPCYPHEITALQLHESARLTLRIAILAAEHGWILKDASAWNVLHSRGRPVFVDVLSFERAAPTGLWIAYGQFVRNFLLPLLLYRKIAMTPQDIFLSHRDGVTPERAYQLLSGFALASVAGLELVWLPRLFTRSGERLLAAKRPVAPRSFDAALALPRLLGTMRRLQRVLERLRPDHSRSQSLWSRYEETRTHYSDADLVAKAEFVRRNLGDARRVLDLGCNAGEFSLIAAESNRTVVSADSDELALSRLYSRVLGTGLPITPTLLNIGRPTPAVGWQNGEVESFMKRSMEQFDCILVLGLMHHLLVTERINIPMLVALWERLAAKRVIVEWVEPNDRKFQQLAGLNAGLYGNLNSAEFEASMLDKFTLIEKLSLPCGTRMMYLWLQKGDR